MLKNLNLDKVRLNLSKKIFLPRASFFLNDFWLREAIKTKSIKSNFDKVVTSFNIRVSFAKGVSVMCKLFMFEVKRIRKKTKNKPNYWPSEEHRDVRK